MVLLYFSFYLSANRSTASAKPSSIHGATTGVGNRFRFLYAVADDGGEACGFQHAEVVAVISRRHGVLGIDAEDLAERIQCGAFISALFIDLDVIDVRECKLDAVEPLQAGQNFRADAFRNEHHIDLFRLGVRFF